MKNKQSNVAALIANNNEAFERVMLILYFVKAPTPMISFEIFANKYVWYIWTSVDIRTTIMKRIKGTRYENDVILVPIPPEEIYKVKGVK